MKTRRRVDNLQLRKSRLFALSLNVNLITYSQQKKVLDKPHACGNRETSEGLVEKKRKGVVRNTAVLMSLWLLKFILL